MEEGLPLLGVSRHKEIRSFGRSAIVGILGLAAIGVVVYDRSAKRVEIASLSSTLLDLDVDSGYGQPHSIQSGSYSGIVATVEPHRTTTFSLIAPTGSEFEWSIASEADATSEAKSFFDSAAFAKQSNKDKVEVTESEPHFDLAGAITLESTGTSATHDFKDIAGKRFLVSAYCATTGEKATKVVHGKYIRREIRSLTAEDRELYLDAIRVLYSTDTKTGVDLYGEQFKGFDWYDFSHIGPKTLNSRWHNSPAFFPAHAAFQSAFEISMQLVHPSTCLCYWDFLYDAEKYSGDTTGRGWGASEMWTSEWFGPMPFTEDGELRTESISNTDKRLSGRWADVKIPRDASSAVGMNDKVGVCHNSYGFARNPYNNNPSEHATRDFSVCGIKTTNMGLPGCKELLGAFAKTTFEQFHASAEFILHQSFHNKLGGAWECGYNLRHLEHDLLESDKPSAASVTSSYAMTIMNLWRQAFYYDEIKTPDACLLSDDFSNCQAYCADMETSLAAAEGFDQSTVVGNWNGDNFGSLDADAWDKLFRTKVVRFLDEKRTPTLVPGKDVAVHPKTGRYYFTAVDADDHATQLQLVTSSVVGVCRPGKISEFMDPMASAADPIFFPLHATFERVWQYMRTAKGMESTWSGHGNNDDDADDVDGSVYHFNPIGWDMDDPQYPFEEVYGIERLPSGTVYTNRELVALFAPDRTELPYVFDELAFRVCTE